MTPNQSSQAPTRKLNANQIISSLAFAQMDNRLEGDTRRMMRAEMVCLQVALQSGEAHKIGEAIGEARRVAEMWGVTL